MPLSLMYLLRRVDESVSMIPPKNADYTLPAGACEVFAPETFALLRQPDGSGHSQINRHLSTAQIAARQL